MQNLISTMKNLVTFLSGKKTYIAAAFYIGYGLFTKNYPIVMQGVIALCGRVAVEKVQTNYLNTTQSFLSTINELITLNTNSNQADTNSTQEK